MNKIYRAIQPAPKDGGFSQEDFWVWGSSVIKGTDGLYHMYVSRWSKELPFFVSWMVSCEIVHAVSDKPEGPFRFSDVALGSRGAQYWDGRSCHNPKITKYKDTYILFYMGSTHPFDDYKDKVADRNSKYCIVGRANKRIGIAISTSPYGPWQRFDAPALDVKPNTYYSFLTSNPSPVIHEDGSVLLMFKSRAYEGNTHGQMNIGIAKAEHYLGPYEVITETPIFGPDHIGEIEDPSIWLDDEGYHMLAKDMRGSICGEHHAGILAHSDDGLNWRLDESPKAYSRTIQWDDGNVEKMGQLERPYPLVQDGKVTHLYFAAMDGLGGFDNGTKSWNLVLPLKY